MCKYVEQMAGTRNMDDPQTFSQERLQLYQKLAACAYWAANGFHSTGEGCSGSLISGIMLENILKESKEYAISEPGCDNNIIYEGFEYTYTPVGGWPEPDVEYITIG